MVANYIFNKKSLIKKAPNSYLTYNLTFISFFPPQSTNNLKFNLYDISVKKKIYVKQSYILLTWFYYLSFLKKKLNNGVDTNKVRVMYLPIHERKFTLTKAPIAHKTRSKEQFNYKFYKFVVKFNAESKFLNSKLSLNNALLFVFLTKKTFQFFETNLFFLKCFKCQNNVNVTSYLLYTS